MTHDPDVTVHALLSVTNGVTDEASQECKLSDVGRVIAELDQAVPTWQAITVVHLEDHPRLLQDARTTTVGLGPVLKPGPDPQP